MAKHERDGAKERVWRGVLTRQAASGLSVRAFCQRERLGESNFYAWRRVIAKRDRENTPRETMPREMRPAFVPAILTGTPRPVASIIIELAGGRRLRLPSSMPMRRLARLVHALEAGPRAAEVEA